MDKGTTNAIQGQIPQVVRSLDELAREGAQRMIAAALELEVEEYIERLRHLRDENGHALVVRNGKAKPRTVSLGAGPVEPQAPRVDDRRPDHRFTSKILPPYMRRSPRLDDALPVLYLCGLSSGDFEEAIPVLLGADAAGFSPSTITRLTRVWEEEHEGWCKRPLTGKEYVYVWADGVYFGIRLGEDKQLACLVLVGVLPDGTKEVIALQDGYRESTDSWLSLLRDLKQRGMPAPTLAIGDGALGFWAALRQVYSGTKEQRCWVHKIANILDKLPKRVQPRAKDMLHEIMYAPDRQSALEDIERFSQEFEAKYPKAVECLLKDQDELLTFFDAREKPRSLGRGLTLGVQGGGSTPARGWGESPILGTELGAEGAGAELRHTGDGRVYFPAEHWIHLRTTNPIESTFSTVKARTKRTKGAGSRKAGLAMAFKLLLGAERRWRKINAPHLVALVQAGVSFPDGEQLTLKAA